MLSIAIQEKELSLALDFRTGNKKPYIFLFFATEALAEAVELKLLRPFLRHTG